MKQTKNRSKLFSLVSFIAIFSWIIYFLKKIPRGYQFNRFHENSTIEDQFEELSPEKMNNAKFMMTFLGQRLKEYESFLLNHKDHETCYLCTQMDNHILRINGMDYEHSKTSIDGNSIHLIKNSSQANQQ